jgi:hypothetical protein
MDVTSIINLAASAGRRRDCSAAALAAQAHQQPKPLNSLAPCYQGGAIVALDFAPEEERPKMTRSNCATTT